jgi:hypothetical protein
MAPNTAIFYDIENLIGPFTGKANTILHLDEIYRRVLSAEGVAGVSVQRAYADWSLPLHRNLRGSVLQVGIEPVQIFNTNPYDKIKNAADVSLIIDAVDLIARRPEITNFVIVSGDGIFAFLAKKLHEHGKRVMGVGFDKITNNIFRNACDLYIGLEKTDQTLVDTINAKKQIEQKPFEPKPAAEVVQPPAQAKIPNKFPKTKYSEAIIAADIPIWRDLADASGSLMVIRKLLEALFTETTESLPDLEISVFMTYLNHYVPGFKVNRFGFSRFSNFMRFMLTGSPFTLYAAEKNSHKIAKRGTVGEKGEVIEDLQGLQIILPDASRYNSIFDVPEGSSFIHTITPTQTKPVPVKTKPATAKPKPVTEVKPVTETPPVVKVKGKPGRKPGVKNKTESKPETKPEVTAEVKPEAKTETKPEEKPEEKPELVKPGLKARRKPGRKPGSKLNAKPVEANTAEVKPVAEMPLVPTDGDSVRKWIKNEFLALSQNDKLTNAEARRLTTPEYCVKTFGIRTPIFKEIETRSNLDEQRTVKGKVKYWKESFKFKNKFYLVYKEWVSGLHTERFGVWLSSVKK